MCADRKKSIYLKLTLRLVLRDSDHEEVAAFAQQLVNLQRVMTCYDCMVKGCECAAGVP